jgi:hypothetical protein
MVYRYCFLAKVLNLIHSMFLSMAGVLGQLIGAEKKAKHHSDPKALELEAAREILAEVFRIRTSEVDEMIRNRFEAACDRFEATGKDYTVSKESGLWPAEFCQEE